MIPDRIFVRGFLCYREPQEARFEDRTLWMLTGPNGSGKSALFDAMTYALFGRHRGGRHHARGLIHKACNEFIVEFDFTLEDQRVRARRTLSKQGRATRQLYRRLVADNGNSEAWKAIPDTHTDRGFSRWVSDHITLNYEAFTASVVLLQGKSDSLLSVGPADRHRLLAQLVGLDRFEHLVERAKQHRSETNGAARNLREQLERIPKIAEFRLVQLREAVQSARARYDLAGENVSRLQSHYEASKRWWTLQQQAEPLLKEAAKLQSLVSDLSRGQASHDRREEINKWILQLSDLADATDRSERCRAIINRLESQQESLRSRLATLDEDETEACAAASRQLDDARTREAALTRQNVEAKATYDTTLQFSRACERLRDSGHRTRKLETQLETARQQHREAERQLAAEEARTKAQRASKNAAEELIRAETACRNLRRRLERLQSVAEEKTCSYCQQPLPVSHVQREQRKLRCELESAETTLAQRQESAQEAEAARACLEKVRETSVRKDAESGVRIQHLTTELQRQQETNSKSERDCRDAYEELPPRKKRRWKCPTHDDWSSNACPTEADLTAAHRSQRETLAALQEATAVVADRDANHREITERRRENLALRRDLRERFRQLDSRIAASKGDLRFYEQSTNSVRSDLPSDWQDRKLPEILQMLSKLRLEETAIEKTSCESDPHQLPVARQRCTVVETRLQAIRGQQRSIFENVPGRPSEIEKEMNLAQAAQMAAESAVRSSVDEESQQDQFAQRRVALAGQLEQTEREHLLWKRLVELLGRQYLQRDLVRTAERAVVEYANNALSRLSSGRLLLELRDGHAAGPNGTRTLDLVARNVLTPTDVHDVDFLSGSQRFRVAVALSLGIGQFASVARRPVQAVIIDEGFGCLDTVNRQVMIQELQHLSKHLKRILLVSHEDEFAGAFTDGYRCELVDGTARLTRYP